MKYRDKKNLRMKFEKSGIAFASIRSDSTKSPGLMQQIMKSASFTQSLQDTKFRLWHFAQRILALMLLIACLPLIAVIYVLVKVDSRGPLIYQQERPGRFGKNFNAFKIRTMCVGADSNPELAHAVTSQTPEVTRVGRYLRDLKLDELPQLWNIARGEMEFVGPRPIAPSLQKHLEGNIPGFDQRLLAYPGMTSLGQICIEENDSPENVVADWKVRFEGEQHYLLHRNLTYDFTIILLTAGYCLRKVARKILPLFQNTAAVLCCAVMLGCSTTTTLPMSSADQAGFSPMSVIPVGDDSPAIDVETVSVESLAVGVEDPIYRLGPGDRISINVFGEPKLDDILVQLEGDGHGQLPLLGRVSFDALTLDEAQRLLESEYGAHFIDPWVVIQLVESLSRPVYLLGEFNQAGVIQMTRPTSLIQALSAGAGLTEDAYTRGARLIRDGQIAAVDIHGLLNRGHMDQNIWLKPDDTVFVPGLQNLRVYVIGAIVRPGAQSLTNGPLSLVQAIGQAGGPLRGQAKLDNVRVIRALSPVTGELYVIDYQRILDGETYDMPLQPDDIVYIPNNGIGNWNDVVEAISPTITMFSDALYPFVLAKALTTD
jgi:polysaccharide export outer membrane protein